MKLSNSMQNAPWTAMSLLFLAHFVVDSQVSFLAPLLPYLREKFEISLATAGILISLQAFCVTASQPLTALITDRFPHFPWLAIGLIGSSFFITAMGWLPLYSAVVISIPLGGFLAGLAHPDMGSRAGSLSDEHRTLAVSVYVSGGRLGFSIGPIIALFIVDSLGMEFLWVYVLINIILVYGIMKGLPKTSAIKNRDSTILMGLGKALFAAGIPLVILLGVTISRSIVTVNLQGLLPTLYVERGIGLWQGGIANSVLLFFGMFGVILGGAFADILGKKKLIITGMLTALIGLVGFLMSSPVVALVFLSILGLGMYMPMGVSMAYAQEFLPDHRGFASSLTLGVSWGFASFSVIPITNIAENIGLMNAFWFLPLALVLALVLAFCLPKESIN
jgi:FSR family fosmidomycin resistance protein-like MFS transporter